MMLVIFAEVLCAGWVVLGAATRLAVTPIIFFFAIALFVDHAQDPWPKKELTLIFATPFVALLFTGPGRFSIDQWIGRLKPRRR